MLPDLLQHLRCPVPHEDSWLVAAALITQDRHIMEGTLGCPICHSEYPIRDGAAWFPGDSLPGDPAVASDNEADLDRLAALLGLGERGGLYVLHGAWGSLATPASALGPVELLLAEPPEGARGAGAIHGIGNTFPMAAACARGVAVDRAVPELIADAVRVLGAGGRLLAPAGAEPTDDVKVLARDDRHWVAERLATATVSAPVIPRRAAPRTGSR